MSDSSSIDALPGDPGPSTVLIIDDLQENRALLRHILQREGHEVLEVTSGEEALALLQKESPDAILLDVMMPGMDGFAVCRRIKETPKTQHIPVLLVTALRQGDYRLQGIGHGADDYISKPYDPRYLALRVRNAVRMKHLRDQVQIQYEKLLESEKMRDGLVHMLVHDMRSPLTAMATSIELLKREADEHESNSRETIDSLAAHTRGLVSMINDILEVNRADKSSLPVNWERCEVNTLIQEAVSRHPAVPGQAKLSIALDESTAPQLDCDPTIVKRILRTLVENALKFTPEDGEVKIGASTDPTTHRLRIEVEDSGSGILPEDQGRIFDKFGQVELRRENHTRSTGIGLAFCKLGIEAMGGRVGVDSTTGRGSVFWIELPQEQGVALAN